MWKMYFEIACMFSRPIQPYIIGLAYFYLAKNNIVILSWAMLLSLQDTIRCASLLFVLMRKMSFDETIIESCCAFAWCNFKWDFLFMPTNYHLYLYEIEPWNIVTIRIITEYFSLQCHHLYIYQTHFSLWYQLQKCYGTNIIRKRLFRTTLHDIKRQHILWAWFHFRI